MASLSVPRQNAPRAVVRELSEVLPGVLLLLVMSGAVVYALSVSAWGPGLEVLRPVALIGLLVGAVFARLRRLPAWGAHLLSAALAVTCTIQLLGSQMDERLATWRDRGVDLLIRITALGRTLAAGGRGEDILLFVVVLCLLCWALAYWTAFAVLRRGWAWRPIVLNAVVALVNYTYVLPKPTLAFFVFLCAALLLLVYQHVLQRQALWDAQRVEYPDLLPIRFLWSSALVCGLLIALTALVPGQVSVDRATRTWDTLSSPFRAAREGWEDMFSTISAPPGAGSGAFTTGTAALGGPRQLSDTLVMEVRSTEYDYWRGVAFDTYTGRNWDNLVGEQARSVLGTSTREQARTPLAADQPLDLSEMQLRRPVVQSFRLSADREDDLVFTGGLAQIVSVPTRVEHSYLEGEGGNRPNFDDTALILSDVRLRAGETYSVTAQMAFADVTSLRAASTEYPAWVRERYLQLPNTLPARVRELAAEVVAQANARTAYDQAVALQDYLRTIPYNEQIPVPPAAADQVDWFLFEQREGYCDYFASAMVVMLRSQGIPARYVRGYAGGEFDATRGVYIVRESVAHSWPEVYFPAYGWQRFEPTAASYTALPQRPLTSQFGEDPSAGGASAIPPPNPGPDRFEDLDEGSTQQIPSTGGDSNATAAAQQNRQALGLLALALGLLALVAAAVAWRWRSTVAGLSRVGAAYAGMELLASWSGLGQEPHRTPVEYGERLGAAIPAHRHTIRQIAAAFAAERYSGRAGALPPEEQQRELRGALARNIFSSIGERLPKPRER